MLGSSKAETNALGPVQEYVPPAIVFAKRFMVVPAHTGVLLEITNATGVGLTTTVVVLIALVQPATVTVNEQVPAIAKVDAGRVGSSNADTNAGGPVQLQVAPTTVFDVSNIVAPVQTGELLPAVGAAGIGFTTTTVVPAILVHPATVTVTLQVPDAKTVALARVGSSNEDENAFGPVHEYVAPAIVFDVKFNVVP